MKNAVQSSDPDIRGTLAALRRAAKNARRLSLETGTPFYIFKNGKIVDLNRGTKKRRKKA